MLTWAHSGFVVLPQMAKVRELVGEMQAIQMEYGEQFWSVLRPVQHARGLTATPHTIYDLNALGIEVGTQRKRPRYRGAVRRKSYVVASSM